MARIAAQICFDEQPCDQLGISRRHAAGGKQGLGVV
jgi:hypothetical protein